MRKTLVVAAAAALAVLVWVVAGARDLPVGPQTVGLANVIVVSLLAGLAATGFAALLGRLTGRPRLIFLVVSLLILLVSLAGPLGADAPASTVLALAAMHLLVGGTLIVGIGSTLEEAAVMTIDAPAWAVRGPRPWTLLIFFPLAWSILIAPVAALATPLTWLTGVVSAALFTGALLTRYRPSALGPVLLVLLAVVATLATALSLSAVWSPVFVLLVIAVASVLRPDRALAGVVATTVLGMVATAVGGGDVTATALTVAFAGLGTYAVYQLFAVVTELRCTREELATMAVARERDRFARDLHDVLGHTLSLIVVKAEAVRRLAPVDGEAAATHAADIETIGRDALADIRRAVGGYRGAGLERELVRARDALSSAGIALVVQHVDGHGVEVHGVEVPEQIDETLGWVVREAVTNVVRHSHATRCTIRVSVADDSTQLTVEDDGDGSTEAPGSGLIGLQERVQAEGGRVSIDRDRPGFRITVDLPVVLVAP